MKRIFHRLLAAAAAGLLAASGFARVVNDEWRRGRWMKLRESRWVRSALVSTADFRWGFIPQPAARRGLAVARPKCARYARGRKHDWRT